MMEQTWKESYLPAEAGEAEIQACIDHFMNSIVGPDETRDRFAAVARKKLEASGLPDPGVAALNLQVYGVHGEDSVEYIASHWLMNYHRLAREREKLENAAQPTNLEMIISYAEDLGRYKERLYWRQGADEATGKRIESLALAGRKQVKNGQNGNAMRTDNSFAVRDSKQAQKYVEELHRRNPQLSWNNMKAHAAKKFEVSKSTIRRNVKNPKKLGSTRSE